ncbi:MAG: hypothetical protein JXR69_03320 [Candidatus Delongbacteria bacterium]|nr:hypothetical protein [Candidatus Delongbacteria bacterium]
MKSIIIFIILSVSLLFAKEFQISSFLLAPNDKTAQIRSMFDDNGNKCAVIKFTTKIPGIDFVSSKIKNNGKFLRNEYRIYVQENIKEITIRKNGFQPFNYQFDSPLISGNTYEAILEEKNVNRGIPAVTKVEEKKIDDVSEETISYISPAKEINEVDSKLFTTDDIKVSNIKLISDKAVVKEPFYLTAGDNNGNIDAGEQINLGISLKAVIGDFISASVKFNSDDEYLKIKTKKINFNDISQGASIQGNNPLIVEINPECPHEHKIVINLKIYDSNKKDNSNRYLVFKDSIKLTVSKVGPIEFSGAIIDDDDIGQSEGNGNQIIEKSDGDIEIPLVLKNRGKADVSNAEVKLTSQERWINISENVKTYSNIPAASEGGTPADYVFKLHSSAPSYSVPFVPMRLRITGFYGPYKYNWIHDFKLGKFFGKLNITVNPSDAEIYVNNEFRNSGSLNEKKPIDDYKIKISKYGYIDEEFEIPVKEDKTTYVEVNLGEKLNKGKDLKSFSEYNYGYDYNLKKYTWQDFYEEPYKLKENRKSYTCKNMYIVLGSLCVLPGIMSQGDEEEDQRQIGVGAIVIGIGLYLYSFIDDHSYKPVPISYNIDKNREKEEIAKRKAEAKAKSKNDMIALEKEQKIAEGKRKIYDENEKIKKENKSIEIRNKLSIKKREVKYKIDNGYFNDITPKINESSSSIYK